MRIFCCTFCSGDVARFLATIKCCHSHRQRWCEGLLHLVPHHQPKCSSNSWCVFEMWIKYPIKRLGDSNFYGIKHLWWPLTLVGPAPGWQWLREKRCGLSESLGLYGVSAFNFEGHQSETQEMKPTVHDINYKLMWWMYMNQPRCLTQTFETGHWFTSTLVFMQSTLVVVHFEMFCNAFEMFNAIFFVFEIFTPHPHPPCYQYRGLGVPVPVPGNWPDCKPLWNTVRCPHSTSRVIRAKPRCK